MTPILIKRSIYPTVLKRLKEPRRFMQALIGPRQVGKSTLAQQVIDELDLPSLYASADDPNLHQTSWIEQQWETARSLIQHPHKAAILVLDEIQKIHEWSSIVKKLW